MVKGAIRMVLLLLNLVLLVGFSSEILIKVSLKGHLLVDLKLFYSALIIVSLVFSFCSIIRSVESILSLPLFWFKVKYFLGANFYWHEFVFIDFILL